MQPPRTFVLRFWREGPPTDGDPPAWRCVVEEVGRERRQHGFGSLEALAAYWRRELQADERGDEGADSRRKPG